MNYTTRCGTCRIVPGQSDRSSDFVDRDYDCEKTVSVLLNHIETNLEFVELKNRTYDDVSDYGPIGALLLVYSITSHQSFQFVSSQLQDMRSAADPTPVIVVANKTDLVRSRQVSEEAGREMCRGWCRFCEVSAVLNHQVDELLVDIVTSLRQSPSAEQAAADPGGLPGPSRGHSTADETPVPGATCIQDSSDTGCVRSAAIMLKGLFTRQNKSLPPASKSRENLID